MSDDSRDTDDSEPLDELDEEFSLDKLSKAYADVIRKRSGDSELAESGEDDSSTRENPAPTTGNKSSASPQRKKTKDEAADTELQADDNHGCPIEQYERDNSAWRIVIEGDGDDAEIKMALAENLAEFQNHYFGRNKEVQLSQGTIDVLAVVAYHQPVTKVEVENTRGKPSGSVLSQLVRRDLLEIEVTKDKPARRLYRTSKRFLDLFQLNDVQDLPQSHDVSEFEEYID